MGCCLKTTFGMSLMIGLAMIVTGVVVLVLVVPSTTEKKIKEGLVLRNGTKAAERFEESPVPSYMYFYFFNVTNMDDVNNKDEKPKLKEIGPYVYRQVKTKNIIQWDERFGTVKYTETTHYHFEDEMSKPKQLDDAINHINVVTISLKRNLEANQAALAALGHNITEILNGVRGELVDTHTVKELLFDGFLIMKYWPAKIQWSCYSKDMCKFGFFINQNGSSSEEYEVATGFRSTDDYTEVKRYAKNTTLSYWYDNYCNALNGTDGKQFHPGVKEEEELYVFSSDVCRSLKFKFDKETTVEGIPTLRFTLPEIVFADPNKNKDNMCFCPENPCPSKAGVIPIFACKDGNPIMASSPHFYQGDAEYWEAFEGLSPQKERHQTFLDIEPMTGTVISGAKRIQISVLVTRIEGVNATRHIKDDERRVFPAFWAQEGGQIDPENANEFKKTVQTPYRTAKWSMVAIIAVGAVILLILAVLAFMKSGRSKQGKM